MDPEGTSTPFNGTDVEHMPGSVRQPFSGSNDSVRNSSADEIEIYYFYKTEQLTFLWILFTTTVVGNSCVLLSLATSNKRKSRMNFFIMHLAAADLSVGLINVLTDIVWRITVEFHGGNVTCKFVKYMQVLVTYSSTYVLVALSIDRYDAITHPLNFSGSWRRARVLVGSAWGLSAVFSLPAVFLNGENVVKGRTQCWIQLQPWQWQIYITAVATSLFFVPAVAIALCYSIIVHTIWTKSNVMATPGKGEANRASSRGIIPKAKIKTVKMTFVIVSVFILCWSPYFVYDLLQVYGYIPTNQTSIAVSTFVQSLAPLNSAANPFIYCLFSTHLCTNLRRFCCAAACKMCRTPWRWRQQRSSDYGTMRETVSRSSARTTSSSVKNSPRSRRGGSASPGSRTKPRT